MKFKREEGGSEFPANKGRQKARLLEKMRESGIPPMGTWDEVDGQPVDPESEEDMIEDGVDWLGRPKKRKRREFEAAMPVPVTGSN